VVDGASYRALTEHTRCHGVMVARGAIGNPWLFEQMHAEETGEPWCPPSFRARCEVIERHIRLEVAQRGETTGCLVVRKHIAKCFKGYPGAARLRRLLYAEETSAGMIAVLEEAARAGADRSRDLEDFVS